MRLLRLVPLIALAFVGACDEDGVVRNSKLPPLAYVRYVNAVPDAPTLDFAFMDGVEFSPSYANSPFRTVGIYQGARAGSRTVRVFRNSSNITTTQIVEGNATLNLVAGKYYTILHSGYSNIANGPAATLTLIEDPLPTQGAGVHISAVNTAASGANPDVFVCTPSAFNLLGGGGQVGTTGLYLTDSIRVQLVDDCGSGVGAATVLFDPSGGGQVRGFPLAASAPTVTQITTAAGNASVRWRMDTLVGPNTLAVTYGSVSLTVNATAPTVVAGLQAASGFDSPVALGNRASVIGAGSPAVATNLAPGARSAYLAHTNTRFTLRTAATGTTAELATATPDVGVAGTVTADPVAGYLIAGSQFTAFLFPPSIAGSGAASFTTPAIVVIPDRQPSRTVPD